LLAGSGQATRSTWPHSCRSRLPLTRLRWSNASVISAWTELAETPDVDIPLPKQLGILANQIRGIPPKQLRQEDLVER